MGRWREAPEGLSLLCRPPGQKVLDAFRKLGAPGLRLLQVRLELHRFLVARRERVVDRALGAGKGLPRLRHEVVGKIANLLLQSLRGNKPVDHAEAVRIGRAQRLAAEE